MQRLIRIPKVFVLSHVARELSDCFKNEAARETWRVETRGIPFEHRNKAGRARDHGG